MLLTLLLSCNRYEFFNIAGYEQAEFSNDADILFVIDNSASMWQEGASLGLNFSTFINQLTSSTEEGQTADGLGDAVDGFVQYVNKRGDFIDYQLAITTSSVDYTGAGPSDGLDPGEAGLLIGNPTIIEKYSDDVSESFKKNLMCDTVYWDSTELLDPENQDPGFECGDEPEKISVQYLDCLCGPSEWDNPAGSGQEEPLEAALLSLCRSVENPPEECYWISPPDENGNGGTPALFGTNDIGTNDGFLRDDSTIVIVIVGDEGDISRRVANGSEDIQAYVDAFEAFDRTIKVAALGPNLIVDGTSYSLPCNNGGATDWAALRLQYIAAETNGFYRSLEEKNESDECEMVDFSVHLDELGELLNNLDTSFRLKTIPDVSSIRVYVDGKDIPNAEPIDPDAVILEYGAGWSYNASQNSVDFWGDPIINSKNFDEGCCIPDYNSDVKIYYRPLAGKPRELPFAYE
jgi:hypothetical protein